MKTFFVILAVAGSLFTLVAVMHSSLFSMSGDEVTLPLYVENSLIRQTKTASPDVLLDDTQREKALPARLSIPSIGVDAKVQHVGINKKGNMATPTNFTDVGWYRYGTLPGRQGSAVIAGHVDNGFAMPGVFKNLNDVKKGDDIYLEAANGDMLHYVVTGFSTYDYDAEAKEVFGQNDDRYLKLITCTGEWMPQHRTHDKRLVVTALQI